MPQESAVYTHGHHESVLRSHTWRTAANSAAYLLDSLLPHMQILDIGCGPGTITADLAALVPDGQVTGLEHAPAVLEQARATADARGVDNVRFAVGDVHALDYPDNSFCVTHAHQVLQHVGDPVQALREMRRVTKPGGIVAVRDADYSAMTWYPEVEGMADWQQLYLRVARANGGEPDAGRRLHAWARQAGFDPARGHRDHRHLVLPHPRRNGPGGASCGRTARSPRPTRGTRWTAATPRRTSWTGSPAPGASGPPRRTAGSPYCTARSCAASEAVRATAGATSGREGCAPSN